MCLKESISSEEFDQYASDTPNVARKRPTQSKDNFGGAIMPCRHNGGVVFVLKGCRAEVDESNFCIEEHLALSSLSIDTS